MGNQNKTARELYQETYRELAELMNQHWQISKDNPGNPLLAVLGRRIRILGACCETWRRIAHVNAMRRLLGGY